MFLALWMPLYAQEFPDKLKHSSLDLTRSVISCIMFVVEVNNSLRIVRGFPEEKRGLIILSLTPWSTACIVPGMI